MVMSYIVVIGNICDGWHANGPFGSFEDALDFVDNDNDNWDIMPLYSVEKTGEVA